MKVIVGFEFDDDQRRDVAEWYYLRLTESYVKETWHVRRGGLATREMLRDYIRDACDNQNISKDDELRNNEESRRGHAGE